MQRWDLSRSAPQASMLAARRSDTCRVRCPCRPSSQPLADPRSVSRLSLHVDLEAEVDFGSRHAAAQAPIFRRALDQRDLDIVWRNIERREIANDGLVKGSLGTHRSPGKHRDFDESEFLPAAGRDSKVRSRMFDQTQRSIPFGNFQCFSKCGLNRVNHRGRVSDPAGASSDKSVGHSRLKPRSRAAAPAPNRSLAHRARRAASWRRLDRAIAVQCGPGL